eukprot:TRINITY_DN12135_c0_g1_i1.p1 TRINITY_DN12135_c0_g1~~TRINITY_DN12135_c0_g1_i1.p1  ORF type:complete len:445 (-),score=116.26 TRINITY_DN12135_c0_g1_i1:56-1390(-)
MWSSFKNLINSDQNNHVTQEKQIKAEEPKNIGPDGEVYEDFPSFSKTLFSIARQVSVGADLLNGGMSLPAELYEPLTILQRNCEMLENATLLCQAAEKTDSLDRMALVAAFAVSGYSNTQRYKSNFNPMLGETFEYDCPTTGAKFLSEQVCHHPPRVAAHAQNDDWVFWQNCGLKTNFMGNSINLDTQGKTHVYFKESKNHFYYTNPESRVNNLVIGKSMWVEHYGKIHIINMKTGETCDIHFKKSGMFKTGPVYAIEGTIKDARGNDRIALQGRWDTFLEATWLHDTADTSAGESQTLWRVNDTGMGGRYNLSEFANGLNTIHDERLLAPTDSRLRCDRRLLEKGDWRTATRIKRVMENKQRVDRKVRAEQGDTWQPVWFHEIPDEEGGHIWVYCGDYWEQKQEKLEQLENGEECENTLYPDYIKNLACDFVGSYDNWEDEEK